MDDMVQIEAGDYMSNSVSVDGGATMIGGFAGPLGDPVPSDIYSDKGMDGMDGMDGGLMAETKVPTGQKLMSSWLFIGGVGAGVLILGIVFGILAGKHRIKKGFDLYED